MAISIRSITFYDSVGPFVSWIAVTSDTASKVRQGGALHGKLLIKSKVAAYKLSVPFSVNLYHGRLRYQPSFTTFYTGPPQLDPSTNPSLARKPDNISSLPTSSHFSFPSLPSLLSTSSSSLSSSLSWSSSLSSSSASLSSLRQEDEVPVPHPRAGHPRNLTITNSFPCPVVVYNVTLPNRHAMHFKVLWHGEVVVGPGKEEVVASVQLLSVGSLLRLRSHLTLHTNLTALTVPLLAYNGRLTKHFLLGAVGWPNAGTRVDGGGVDSLSQLFDVSYDSDREEEDEHPAWSSDDAGPSFGPSLSPSLAAITEPPVDPPLDLGTLGLAERRSLQFLLYNDNPVLLRLHSWSTNASWCSVQLLGVREGVGGVQEEDEDQHGVVWVSRGWGALFRLSLASPSVEGVFWADVSINTPHELLRFTVRLRTAQGHLSILPSPVVFQDAFPGKVSSVPLHVLSTFSHSMAVQAVLPQQQFLYHPAQEGGCNLRPDTLTPIGELVFDPARHCGQHCYTGFDLGDKLGQLWVGSLSLSMLVTVPDAALLRALRQRYNASTTHYNTTLVLHTSHLHAFSFTVQVSLSWPRLAPAHQVVVPLTPLHNRSVATLELRNPSTRSHVYIQLLFLHQYPQPHVLAEAMAGETLSELWDVSGSSSEVFRILDVEAEGGDATMLRRVVGEDLNTRAAEDTTVLKLAPGQQVRVLLSFVPPAVGTHSALLLIRNNLTVVDVVSLRGSGGQGAIKFGNRRPDSETGGAITPLTFSIAAKHLRDCEDSHRGSGRHPKLTVKRTFTARNTGDLPVRVTGFLVGGSPCESYGFKVIQCESFSLSPNASRKVDVAFTPDFTLSKVQQRLSLLADVGGAGRVLHYTLHATLPPQLLARCSAALPRPSWEPLLRYTVVTLLVLMLVATLLVAMMDADTLVKENVSSMTALATVDKDKMFDLRAIGKGSVSSIASTKVKTQVSCLNGLMASCISSCNGCQRHHESRNSSTKAGCSSNNSATSNGNAKRLSCYSLLTSNTSVTNLKFKPSKCSDLTSDAADFASSTAAEYKAKDIRSKSASNFTNYKLSNLRGAVNASVWCGAVMARLVSVYTAVVGLVCVVVAAVRALLVGLSGAGRRSTCTSKTRGSNTDHVTGYTAAAATNSKSSNSSSQLDAFAARRPTESSSNSGGAAASAGSSKIKAAPTKEPADHKVKSKRRSKECSGPSLNPALSAAQVQEEETSSCTTEASNSDDLSSDKDTASSKSESPSSHSNNKYSYKKSSIKGTNKGGIIKNPVHKQITKSRSQPSMACSFGRRDSSSASPSPHTTPDQPISHLHSDVTTEGNTSSNPVNKDTCSSCSSSSSTSSFSSSSKVVDESSFEIRIRGKGLRRGKGCSVRVTDITADHLLELPYSPKTASTTPYPHHTVGKRRGSRIKSESSMTAPIAGVGTDTSAGSVRAGGDGARPVKPLASVVGAAALIRKKSSVSNSNDGDTVTQASITAPTSPPQLPPSVGHDSYSAKVLGNEKLKAKVTPVGKILPEVKRVQPQRPLGAIGQKLAPTLTESYKTHSPSLNLYSPDILTSHTPLQQFYMSPSPLSMHSWDPKILSSSHGTQPPGLAPSPISSSGLDGWSSNNQFKPPTSLSSKGVWSGDPSFSTHFAAPSSPSPAVAPWDRVASIWSSDATWSAPDSNSLSSLWAGNNAVSQGLGFDPVGGWGTGPSRAPQASDTWGWPAQSLQQQQSSSSDHKDKHL